MAPVNHHIRSARQEARPGNCSDSWRSPDSGSRWSVGPLLPLERNPELASRLYGGEEGGELTGGADDGGGYVDSLRVRVGAT
jgi:hypothetical protein